MQRGNKLWEGNRIILPEHRAYMVELESRQSYIERPVLDEDQMNEMNTALGEALQRGVLVTLTVYKQSGCQEIVMLPKRIEGDRLRGMSINGDPLSVPVRDVVDAVLSV